MEKHVVIKVVNNFNPYQRTQAEFLAWKKDIGTAIYSIIAGGNPMLNNQNQQ
ncbi:hypothetical protein [Microbacter margulisiae]|uniref:Uncharacterized protein n=1 Tax=Microbacter margulisiae TaxID=1350067 RepID=A0A7W5H2T0_9PORP|nr:hypothetical protein [Microbacter margulisiae]MBB3188105.1 hypothetical protein [Microbacter margulisiae]